MKTDNDFGVLVAVADHDMRETLIDALGAIYKVHSVDSAAHILEILEGSGYRAVFLGSGMPGLSVSELLEILSDKQLDVGVILVADEFSKELRADAVEAGAEAVLMWPFDAREAVALIQKMEQCYEIEKRNAAFVARELDLILEYMGVADGELKKVIDRVFEKADDDSPVLIRGAKGTGKRLIAKAMTLAGPRPLGPFEVFNAKGKTDARIETVLFGAARQPGLVEKTRGGTLVIRGIGDVPIRLQDRLHRAMDFTRGEELFIFTSNIDLHGAVLRGEFHEGLWKTIENNIVNVPGLAGRPASIEKIALRVIEYYSELMGSQIKEIHPSALNLLKNYAWPGNIRELERTIALAVGRSSGPVLLPDDLSFIASKASDGEINDLSLEEVVAVKLNPLVDTIEDLPEGELYRLVMSKIERPLLKLVLDKLRGNQVKASAVLGLHRNTLRKKIRDLGIAPKSPYLKKDR